MIFFFKFQIRFRINGRKPINIQTNSATKLVHVLKNIVLTTGIYLGFYELPCAT